MTRILITGSNRGIGHALIGDARARGWTALGSHRRAGAGADLVFDVTDRAALGHAARDLSGPIDILINNAGIIGPERQSPLDMDFDGFAETLAVNTMAPLAVAQAFLPHLRQSPRPRIITISSQMAFMGYRKPDRIAYRASKAAVNKVMQGLATDLETEGIPVVVIDPGWVITDMGGDDADHSAADVARGVLDLATRLTPADTGKFFRWTGEERDF